MKKEILEFKKEKAQKKKERAEKYGDCGRKLREGREALGFSQKDFAREVGISNTQYNKQEQGKERPSRESLKKISAYLGKPYIELVRAAEYNTVKADNALYDKAGQRIDTEKAVMAIYRSSSDLLASFQEFDRIGNPDNVELLLTIIKLMGEEVKRTGPEHTADGKDELFLDTFSALKKFVQSSYASL